MITRVRIDSFKLFESLDLELEELTVFVGPNNSGKTSALQALSLWDIGLRAWLERRVDTESRAKERTGVAINRKDIFAVPILSAKSLWRDLRVRLSNRDNGKTRVSNVRISITVEGFTGTKRWKAGLEFDFANDETLYVRPNELEHPNGNYREEFRLARETKVAYLPPMSGLAAQEYRKESGEIGVLIGQGQTAQVLRNLCYRAHALAPQSPDGPTPWQSIVDSIHRLFGVELLDPVYREGNSQIDLAYRESRNRDVVFDIASSGRGLQQVLLMLSFMALNPGSVVLLDEPDAHLEVLRQRQVLKVIQQNSSRSAVQILAASHSEVVLNEAVQTGKVIAFLGNPHVLVAKDQLAKSLNAIGWDQYLSAEKSGWILYVEGATDLDILKAFSRKLDRDEVFQTLDNAFVNYLGTNRPVEAERHFYGIREAKADLVGFALYDNLPHLPPDTSLIHRCWSRREIENYFATKDVLSRWIDRLPQESLFDIPVRDALLEAMEDVERARATLGQETWSNSVKVSDEVLGKVFELGSRKLGVPPLLTKGSYWKLIDVMDPSEVDPEVSAILNLISETASKARPL